MDVSTMLVQVELYLTRENPTMWTVLTQAEVQLFMELPIQSDLYLKK